MRILLADDSHYILDWLQDMLHECRNVEVVGSFNNGSDALEGLKKLKPDLAILDIKMPGLSGIEVLKEIRKENKSVKIIILTFFAMDHYRDQAAIGGADYFFSKVDEYEKISLVVSEMLDKESGENTCRPTVPPVEPIKHK
jgi:DNA-binding NarL/FixJ family response regulator